MMILEYQISNAELMEIEAKLKELTLAFKKKQVKSSNTLVLIDGNVEVIGKKAILNHLRILEGELNSWYYCNC